MQKRIAYIDLIML